MKVNHNWTMVSGIEGHSSVQPKWPELSMNGEFLIGKPCGSECGRTGDRPGAYAKRQGKGSLFQTYVRKDIHLGFKHAANRYLG
jgi:hypothetical protein